MIATLAGSQVVRHLTVNQVTAGSNPALPAILTRGLMVGRLALTQEMMVRIHPGQKRTNQRRGGWPVHPCHKEAEPRIKWCGAMRFAEGPTNHRTRAPQTRKDETECMIQRY